MKLHDFLFIALQNRYVFLFHRVLGFSAILSLFDIIPNLVTSTAEQNFILSHQSTHLEFVQGIIRCRTA